MYFRLKIFDLRSSLATKASSFKMNQFECDNNFIPLLHLEFRINSNLKSPKHDDYKNITGYNELFSCSKIGIFDDKTNSN